MFIYYPVFFSHSFCFLKVNFTLSFSCFMRSLFFCNWIIAWSARRGWSCKFSTRRCSNYRSIPIHFSLNWLWVFCLLLFFLDAWFSLLLIIKNALGILSFALLFMLFFELKWVPTNIRGVDRTTQGGSKINDWDIVVIKMYSTSRQRVELAMNLSKLIILAQLETVNTIAFLKYT